MRVIIAGSRSITDPQLVVEAVAASGIIPSVVLCGGARGADELGAAWAKKNNVAIEYYFADWTHGAAAGPMRNTKLVASAKALIAIWDGVSRGTADVIRKARKHGLKVYVHETRDRQNCACAQPELFAGRR